MFFWRIWLKRTIIFSFFLAIGIFLYVSLFSRLIHNFFYSVPLLLILSWAIAAYLLIPLVHRLLTKLYVPDYFVGRARTGDGLLSDPVNLAFNGSREDLKKLFADAGWHEAEALGLRTVIKWCACVILRKSYPTGPVSNLYLFGNRHELAFQIELDNSPHRRHHVRIWRTPKKWWLPGGAKQVEWLAAATFDASVGFSDFTLQITHNIAEDIDSERDFVWKSLDQSKISVTSMPHFMTAFRARGSGGDNIRTDGTLIMIDVLPKRYKN